MNSSTTKSIAVIGAGVSGIAVARVLSEAGHHVTVFEKSERIGGIWASSYPGVSLQNTRDHYFLSDFDYPNQPQLHPTAQEITDYLAAAVDHFQLEVRIEHEVMKAAETNTGWQLDINTTDGRHSLEFDFLIVSTGQYNAEKYRPEFPGQQDFAGKILTEVDIDDLELFNGKRVAVVGFGKSAVDMAVFALENGAQVDHVFRTPRWLIPFNIFGIHYSRIFFSRLSTGFMPSWAHSSRWEQFLHQRLGILVAFFWSAVTAILKLQLKFLAWRIGANAKRQLALVQPTHNFLPDLRSALALAPRPYYRYVATERISPHHSELAAFTRDGLSLTDGTEIECDIVVLSTGSKMPVFPFLPDRHRALLEAEDDGVQLYRHMLHPRISKLAFAGFNHGFMHIPSAEIGALWLSAVIAGDLRLPSTEAQEAAIGQIRAWKRQHINFEPSRSCAVNTRFQQYNDTLLRELGLSPYRKLPNIFAELAAPYGAGDYAGVVHEYLSNHAAGTALRAGTTVM